MPSGVPMAAVKAKNRRARHKPVYQGDKYFRLNLRGTLRFR